MHHRHYRTPLWVSVVAALAMLVATTLLFGGVTHAAADEAQSSSGIEVASTAASDHQMVAKITRVTSSGTHITSTVSVQGTWAVDKLEKGQSFTIEAGPYLKWSSNFPFTLDTGERIGECVTSEGTLTCTVTEVPASMVDKTNVTGHWWADSKIQEASVGRTVTELTLNGKTTSVTFGDSNGDGTCDRDCGPVHYPYASIDNFKAGWINHDNSTSWMISWIAEPGVEYTIRDLYTELSDRVECATGVTWDPDTTDKITAERVDPHTIKMIAPDNAKVCVTYTPNRMYASDGEKTVINKAEVNGVVYESTVEIKSAGGTDGNGTNAPKPTPTPTPTPSVTPTPSPSPSAPSPSVTPTPTPSASPSPTPTPSTTPSTTPSPTPSVTPAPSPTPTATPTPEPTPSTPSVTPEPTPSPSPSTTPEPSPSAPSPTPLAPTPSTTPSVTPTPSPSTTPTRRPVPLPTPVIERYKEPTPSAIPTPAPQRKLAVTGTDGSAIAGAVALLALGSFILWVRRRQTARSEG